MSPAPLADGHSWLAPPPPEPPPDAVPRENIRVILAALGLPVDDVRDLSIGPSAVTFNVVVRDESGAVVMQDGLPSYRAHTAVIVEPDGSAVGT